MLTWLEFKSAEPGLAAEAQRLFYQWKVGLAALATVRPDGGPRVHPICPLITDDGLFGFIVSGPKLEDLKRDGRYSLHSESVPPPNYDDGFYFTGRVSFPTDTDVRARCEAQFKAERPDFDFPMGDQTLVEFHLERALLMITNQKPTVWRAPS